MSNKRIQKKRAKVAKYRARIELVARLVADLCPYDTPYEKRQVALALWNLDDKSMLDTWFDIMARRTPLRNMLPRLTSDAPVMDWRSVTAFMPSAADRLMVEIRR